MVQVYGRRYDTHDPVRVDIDDGRIARVGRFELKSGASALPWMAPGLVDLQVNGYGGQEFSSPALTPDKVTAIVERHDAFGVTRLYPTLTTASLDVLGHGLKAIAAACEASADIARRVPGIHLEGPFMSLEDGPRGAHPAEHCRRPNWDEFSRLQDAAGGRIKLLTMSPEFDESAEVIARAVASGVVVAIGHTAAEGPRLRAAVDAGASLSTHLGNGAHRVLRRHPNYIWQQLAEDRLMASLIVDGHHLPPEVVKTFIRAKTPARTILVSDVSGLAGLGAGRYTTSGCELEILADGRLVIAGQDQLLAGASRPLGAGVVNAMRFAGVDLATAIEMATANPVRLMGLHDVGLRQGDAADLVLFDLPDTNDSVSAADLPVRATVSGGRVVYGRLWSPD